MLRAFIRFFNSKYGWVLLWMIAASVTIWAVAIAVDDLGLLN